MSHANLSLIKHKDAKGWGQIHKDCWVFSPYELPLKGLNIESLKSPETNVKLTQKCYETKPVSRYIPTFNALREHAKMALQNFHWTIFLMNCIFNKSFVQHYSLFFHFEWDMLIYSRMKTSRNSSGSFIRFVFHVDLFWAKKLSTNIPSLWKLCGWKEPSPTQFYQE